MATQASIHHDRKKGLRTGAVRRCGDVAGAGQERRGWILRNDYSPGDIVLMTAAVRDLHRTYPDRFLTDVRTSCFELWEHNPYVHPLEEDDPRVEVVDCHYPLIDSCNRLPYHAIHGFIEFLNERLGLAIRPTEFCGDIHLSEEEKSWYSQVRELAGRDLPFWIVDAGGKYDVTIKWWETARWQEVIDHFRDRIIFVQVGAAGHHHPPLDGVIDLRGRTTLRELVRLVYHAAGALCSVTALMHLAAAVEYPYRPGGKRPCVVVAGGREPAHWTAYPDHQLIHTTGALPCCTNGGCWRDRVVPLGDGDVRDNPEHLCLDVSGRLPRCLDLITSRDVARRIEWYFQGGYLTYLTRREAETARRAVVRSRPNDFASLAGGWATDPS